MNDDNGFGVPAGWYPDPLGLPQMRWWDNHGWTEHTTEARAPVVVQEAKLAWADDDVDDVEELPTRREMREREQRENGSNSGDGSDSVAGGEALLELEPPSWDALPADEPAPAGVRSSEFTSITEGRDPASPSSSTRPETAAEPARVTGNIPAHPVPFAPGTPPSTNTAGAWIIALLPLVQLVLTLLIVSASGPTGTSVEVILGILGAPYVISIPLAIGDRRILRRHGYEHPASWAWVLLSGPVYLIARAVRILMRAGNGFAPLLVWGALALLQLGSVVAVPGLVISALPQVFSDQAAASIHQSASSFGEQVSSVTCPTPPATVMGQQFTCTLMKVGSRRPDLVTVSLQRQNGWISWPVSDWGDYSFSR